jgi:type IX secretion system PorP/SprF family membrane protein
VQLRVFYIILINIFATSYINAQQEMLFSQINKTMEFVNPAYNSTKGEVSGLILHRNQWTGFEGAPRVTALNVHKPFKKRLFGIGVIGLHETIGLRSNIFAGATSDVTVKVGRNSYLASGIQLGVENVNYNTANMRAYSEVPLEMIESVFIPSVGFGALLFSKKIQFGFSTFFSANSYASHNRNNSMNFNLSTSYTNKISNNWHVKPMLLAKYYTEYLNSAEFGVLFLYKDVVWFGVSYRLKEAAIFMSDIKLTNILRLGYSYDASLNNVRLLNSHTHEIRLSFQLMPKDENNNQRTSTGR